MASFSHPNWISGLVVAADYTAEGNLYKAVIRSTSADNTVEVVSGAAARATGFLYNQANTGQAANVAGPGGGSRARAAATIAAGDELATDASGDLVVATAGQFVIAVASEAAVSGDIFEVEVVNRVAV